MKLSTQGVRYSPGEQKAFALLTAKPKTTIELTDAIYKNGNRPFNSRDVVRGMMKRLMDKIRLNKEPFIVRCTERRGPHPLSFWVEKRK
jgi:hypothetical protein